MLERIDRIAKIIVAGEEGGQHEYRDKWLSGMGFADGEDEWDRIQDEIVVDLVCNSSMDDGFDCYGLAELSSKLDMIGSKYKECSEKIMKMSNAIKSSEILFDVECLCGKSKARIIVEAVDSVYKVACDEFERIMAERDADREEYAEELKREFDERKAVFMKRRQEDPDGYGEEEMKRDIEEAQDELDGALESVNDKERSKDIEDASDYAYNKAYGMLKSEIKRIKSEVGMFSW